MSSVLRFLGLSRYVCRFRIAWTFVRALESASHECCEVSICLHSLVATSSRLCCVLVRSAVYLWFRCETTVDITLLVPNPGRASLLWCMDEAYRPKAPVHMLPGVSIGQWRAPPLLFWSRPQTPLASPRAAVMERHICDAQEVSGAAEKKRKISYESERSQLRGE